MRPLFRTYASGYTRIIYKQIFFEKNRRKTFWKKRGLKKKSPNGGGNTGSWVAVAVRPPDLEENCHGSWVAVGSRLFLFLGIKWGYKKPKMGLFRRHSVFFFFRLNKIWMKIFLAVGWQLSGSWWQLGGSWGWQLAVESAI